MPHNLSTPHTFTPLAVADLLDHLCAAVDKARSDAAGNQRWLNAIGAAWDYLLQVDEISYDQAAGAIRVESATEAGKHYTSNGDCQCRAFTHGAGVCWHRAAARLVRRALELRNAVEGLALRDELLMQRDASDFDGRKACEQAKAELPALLDYAAEWDRAAAASKAAFIARLTAARAPFIAAA